jgi:hypothetical protein
VCVKSQRVGWSSGGSWKEPLCTTRSPKNWIHERGPHEFVFHMSTVIPHSSSSAAWRSNGRNEDSQTRKPPPPLLLIRSWKPRLDVVSRVGDCGGEKSGFIQTSNSDSVRSTAAAAAAATTRSASARTTSSTNRLSSITMTTTTSSSFMEVTTEDQDQVLLDETTLLSRLNLMQWLQTSCPVDVVPLVLAYSGPQQTAVMSRVNRHWRSVVQQESTWRVMCEQLYKVKTFDDS